MKIIDKKHNYINIENGKFVIIKKIVDNHPDAIFNYNVTEENESRDYSVAEDYLKIYFQKISDEMEEITFKETSGYIRFINANWLANDL